MESINFSKVDAALLNILNSSSPNNLQLNNLHDNNQLGGNIKKSKTKSKVKSKSKVNSKSKSKSKSKVNSKSKSKSKSKVNNQSRSLSELPGKHRSNATVEYIPVSQEIHRSNNASYKPYDDAYANKLDKNIW